MSQQDLHERIDHDFKYHKPDSVAGAAHEKVRDLCRGLAHTIVEETPPGRAQSVAITHLEDVMMWANAAIARGR